MGGWRGVSWSRVFGFWVGVVAWRGRSGAHRSVLRLRGTLRCPRKGQVGMQGHKRNKEKPTIMRGPWLSWGSWSLDTEKGESFVKRKIGGIKWSLSACLWLQLVLWLLFFLPIEDYRDNSVKGKDYMQWKQLRKEMRQWYAIKHKNMRIGRMFPGVKGSSRWLLEHNLFVLCFNRKCTNLLLRKLLPS